MVSTRLTGMDLEVGLPATVVWTVPCDRPSSEISCDAAVLASLRGSSPSRPLDGIFLSLW